MVLSYVAENGVGVFLSLSAFHICVRFPYCKLISSVTNIARLDLNYLSPANPHSNEYENSAESNLDKADELESSDKNTGTTQGEVDPAGGGNTGKKISRTAFENLVLPAGHKKMIQSLIAQHFRDKKASENESDNEKGQVDIVRGKGKVFRGLHQEL
jgi:hypothetical protein